MRQTARLKAFPVFPQRNGHGPTTGAYGEADEKDCHQSENRKRDQSIGSCKPLQYLLGLGIGILGRNLMDLSGHHVAILGTLKRDGDQEESQEEGKAQQAHQCAHAGPLAAAHRNGALAPVT